MKYLIVGNGRLARHWTHLLSLHQQNFVCWNRRQNSIEELDWHLATCDFNLLCISDDAISDFFASQQSTPGQFIHFSGRLFHESIWGFHPLASLSGRLLAKEDYQRIHFIGDRKKEDFQKVFPFMENRYHMIEANQKALYHALCVLVGNGTTLLWQRMAEEFANLGLPKSAIDPYLELVAQNILLDDPDRFTGPWYRRDLKTVQSHRQALQFSSLLSLYNDLTETSQQLRIGK